MPQISEIVVEVKGLAAGANEQGVRNFFMELVNNSYQPIEKLPMTFAWRVFIY